MNVIARPSSAFEHPAANKVRLAIGDYDRTRPLIDGRVKIEGVNLEVNTAWIGEFCHRPVYEEYDAAEMSLSWYVMAHMRKEPVVALPIFVLRMPVLSYVFVRKDSNITKPSDLIGKRIGTILYRITVNLWLRGIFQQYYGLSPNDTRWVITEETEGAGYVIPDGITYERRTGASPFDLLRDGSVDAVYSPELPEGFDPGTSDIRRLFPDAQTEMRSFVQRTGINPMTHTVVVSESLATQRPQLATSLTDAFIRSQDICDRFWQADPKHLSFPDAVHFIEQQREAYGSKPYQMGLEPNRKALEAFVRYSHEQGYIASIPDVERLFWR